MDMELARLLSGALDRLTEKVSMQEVLLRKIIELLEQIRDNAIMKL